MKIGIISDTHNHNWSAFSKESSTNGSVINSRLKIILDETLRAAQQMKADGCEYMIHVGDLFHVRGSVAPSVLNPTLDAYQYIVNNLGLKIVALAGNHDLEGKESTRLGSAMTALESVGVDVVSEARFVDTNGELLMIPWQSSIENLKMLLLDYADAHNASNTNAFIHAPVNGVIAGIPDSGLDPEWLSRLGFKAIYAGHYHNHKDFGNHVYSVGATTHQTWGDVGSKAGFLIVDVSTNEVRYHASHAPIFVDFESTWDEDDVQLIVDGNYVRARIEIDKPSEIEELRAFLSESGAAGVVIHPVRNLSAAVRTGSSVSSGAKVEVSIADFIKSKSYINQAAVQAQSIDVLNETEVA